MYPQAFFRLAIPVMAVLAFAQTTLNNDSVIKMKGAGLADDTIIKAIEASPGQFDTSVDGLINLKKSGVGEGVIGAILTKGAPKTAAPAPAPESEYPDEIGVYYRKDNKWILLEPEIMTVRTARAAAAFTYGIKAAKLNGWVVKPNSRNRLGPAAEFVMKAPDGTQPSEFQLLKFQQKGDRREVELGRGRINISIGAHRAALPFEHERVGKGVYKIKLSALAAGEYGFLPPGTIGNANQASTGKVYSFGVE